MRIASNENRTLEKQEAAVRASSLLSLIYQIQQELLSNLIPDVPCQNIFPHKSPDSPKAFSLINLVGWQDLISILALVALDFYWVMLTLT
jgi:hypothetical protein